MAAVLAGCGGTNTGAVPQANAAAVQLSASQYAVLYSFAGGSDGAYPFDAPLIDATTGALYGTTAEGGIDDCYFLNQKFGCGTIFKLTPAKSGYSESVLYRFCPSASSCVSTGSFPVGGLIAGKNGRLWLYGAASRGGNTSCTTPDYVGCGTAFRIGAAGNDFQVLQAFDGADGFGPNAPLTPTAPGPLYSTTNLGGAYGYGTVYKLQPSESGYRESVLYSFKGTTNGPDGAFPADGVTLSKNGALFGVTVYGGTHGRGAVYKVTPLGPNTERIIHSFGASGDGFQPFGGLIVDKNGVVYGTTSAGGAHSGGVVFELARSRGNYVEKILYDFCSASKCTDGSFPTAGVTSADGALYGTTESGGAYNDGTVFRLARSGSHYTEQVLHSFGASGDGAEPNAGVVVGADGALYGTTEAGGANGYGTVFRLKP